jgi:hypothetical protein
MFVNQYEEEIWLKTVHVIANILLHRWNISSIIFCVVRNKPHMEEKNPEPENTLKSNCGVKVSHMAKFTTKTVSLGMKIYKHVKGKVPTFFNFCKSFFL